MLVVGFLTALEPARQVASREGLGQPDSIEFTGIAEGADLALKIEPGTVGLNRFEVSLADRLGRPIENASDVSVRISYLDDELGEQVLQAAPVGGGLYVAEEGRFSVAGAWQTELVVRRPDAFDARTAFRFELEAGGSGAITPSPETGQVLLGAGLVSPGGALPGDGDAAGRAVHPSRSGCDDARRPGPAGRCGPAVQQRVWLGRPAALHEIPSRRTRSRCA